MTEVFSVPATARSARTTLALATLVVTATGAVLGLPHAPGGATLVFVVAALAAFGTRAGFALGALALIAGLGTAPLLQPTLVLPAVGMGLTGLGLGLLGRELDRLAPSLPSTLVAGALLALLATMALALPEGQVLLAGADGAPLALPALVVDGSSFVRVATELPAFIAYPRPGGSLTAIALLAALLAALLLLIVHLRDGGTSSAVGPGQPLGPAIGGPRASGERRAAWELAALASALASLVAMLGLAQLLGIWGQPTLQAESLRQLLDLAGTRDGAVIDLALPATTELRLWSRPWVDGLRLLPALALFLLSLRQLRSPPLTFQAHSPIGLSLCTPCALAMTALGTGIIASTQGISGPVLGLSAGLVLGLGAVVAGRTWDVDPLRHAIAEAGTLALAPLMALASSALMWVFAWLVTPLFGA